jgi:hypothetical protein
LSRATEKTTKGAYHKIKHIKALLSSIDPAKVRKRCRCCDELFDAVNAIIDPI